MQGCTYSAQGDFFCSNKSEERFEEHFNAGCDLNKELDKKINECKPSKQAVLGWVTPNKVCTTVCRADKQELRDFYLPGTTRTQRQVGVRIPPRKFVSYWTQNGNEVVERNTSFKTYKSVDVPTTARRLHFGPMDVKRS